jgi:hypothetical protein
MLLHACAPPVTRAGLVAPRARAAAAAAAAPRAGRRAQLHRCRSAVLKTGADAASFEVCDVADALDSCMDLEGAAKEARRGGSARAASLRPR